jgi:hypothetical protein
MRPSVNSLSDVRVEPCATVLKALFDFSSLQIPRKQAQLIRGKTTTPFQIVKKKPASVLRSLLRKEKLIRKKGI